MARIEQALWFAPEDVECWTIMCCNFFSTSNPMLLPQAYSSTLPTNDSFSQPAYCFLIRITTRITFQFTIHHKKTQNETDSSLLLSSAYCFGRHQKDSSLGHAPEWCQVGHLEHSKEDDQFAVDSSNWFENWLQNGTFNGLAALRYEMSEDGPMQGAAELIHTSTILCTL